MYIRTGELNAIVTEDFLRYGMDALNWFHERLLQKANAWANDDGRRRIPGPLFVERVIPQTAGEREAENMRGERRYRITVQVVMSDEFPDMPTLQYGACDQCSNGKPEHLLVINVGTEQRPWFLCRDCKAVRDVYYGTEFFKDKYAEKQPTAFWSGL